MHGVLPGPRARRVGGDSAGLHLHAQRSVAPALDAAVSGFGEDGKVGCEPVGMVAREAAEAVEAGLDLFMVVEDPRDVRSRLTQGRGEVEEDGVPALHIDRPSAPKDPAFEPSGNVARDGDGVRVPGQEYPHGLSEIRARHHGVAVPEDFKAPVPSQGRFDFVGDPALLPRDGGNVHKLRRQGHDVVRIERLSLVRIHKPSLLLYRPSLLPVTYCP